MYIYYKYAHLRGGTKVSHGVVVSHIKPKFCTRSFT